MSRERRRLFQEEETAAEPGRYGCPMLVRSRFTPPRAAGPMMRCSLGWALHNGREVARCAAVEMVADCWKAHPERAPVLLLPTTEQRGSIETDADPAVVQVAGD
jgi:hypothetical protein